MQSGKEQRNLGKHSQEQDNRNGTSHMWAARRYSERAKNKRKRPSEEWVDALIRRLKFEGRGNRGMKREAG